MIDQVALAHAQAPAPGAPVPAPHDVATVGIVVTTYNHAQVLEEALASVVAQRVRANDVVVVPISSGVGARLGVNVGYLSYSRERNILPF